MSNNKEKKQEVAQEDLEKETSKVEEGKDLKENQEEGTKNEEAKEGTQKNEEVKNQSEPLDENKEEAKEEQKESDDVNYLRLMADFQNYKKRVEKEKSDIHAFANEKIITKLLDVTDNFERALVHAPSEESKFHQGMEMILEQLKTVMKDAGVTEIEALNADFDPMFHNAVMMEDVEEAKKDKVIEVLQKGYTLRERVIRPSMVKVGK